jgi:hypothetical protein
MTVDIQSPSPDIPEKRIFLPPKVSGAIHRTANRKCPMRKHGVTSPWLEQQACPTFEPVSLGLLIHSVTDAKVSDLDQVVVVQQHVASGEVHVPARKECQHPLAVRSSPLPII